MTNLQCLPLGTRTKKSSRSYLWRGREKPCKEYEERKRICAFSAKYRLTKFLTFHQTTALQRKLTFCASDFSPLRHAPLAQDVNIISQNRSGWRGEILRKLLSEPMGHRRAQMLRRKTRRSGRSGQGDACEEQAQGNGETPVRAMRHQARTRRGGGIPPTTHRDANGGCSAREESSFSPKGATSMRRLAPAPEGATRGHGRGR